MKPIVFEEQTQVLGKPNSMSDEECGSLPVLQINGQCISCWELSPEEIKLVVETGKLWIGVYSGMSQPPVCPSVIEPIELKIAKDIKASKQN